MPTLNGAIFAVGRDDRRYGAYGSVNRRASAAGSFIDRTHVPTTDTVVFHNVVVKLSSKMPFRIRKVTRTTGLEGPEPNTAPSGGKKPNCRPRTGVILTGRRGGDHSFWQFIVHDFRRQVALAGLQGSKGCPG